MTLTDLQRARQSWADLDRLVDWLADAVAVLERGDNLGLARKRLDILEQRIAALADAMQPVEKRRCEPSQRSWRRAS